MKKLLLILAVTALMLSCGKNPLDKSIFKPLSEKDMAKIETENPELFNYVVDFKEFDLSNESDEAKKTYGELTYRRVANVIKAIEESQDKSLANIATAMEEQDELAAEFVGYLILSELSGAFSAPQEEPTPVN